MTAVALPTAPPARTLRVRDRVYPVVPPSVRDPRLHVAAVIVSVQVLGQVSLGFELSIAQILLSILTCGLLEVGITLWRRHAIVWPASALLTGNGVALILRVQGTRHGDWWSLHGGWIFAAVAAVSLLSKYAVRVGGRQLFNPSNVGLVVAFVVLGTNRVNPQDLWWGPMSVGLAVTYAVILAGGIAVVCRLRMVALAATFWSAFAAGVGVVALTGHAISARWHVGPVSGWQFWWVLVTSPEILIFLFFMITDPRTSPEGRSSRIVYAAAVAFLAALFMAPASTEFWTKVAILGALTVVCAARPLLERVHVSRPRWGTVAGASLAGAGLIVLAGLPARSPVIPTVPRVDASQLASRPDVRLAPGEVPAPTIDTAVRSIVPSLDRAQAGQRAHDLVADLVIAGDALAARNPRLAATAGAGTWLLDLQQQIAAAGNDRPIRVPRYRLASIELVLVRRTGQSSPQVMLSVSGTVRTDTYASAGAPPARGAPTPYRRAYLMTPVAGVWLVVSAQPPV